jgi:CRISPR-associated protein Cas2
MINGVIIVQVLVTYDVSTQTPAGRKRLRQVAQICVNYGQRVQKSVFECMVDQIQYELMVNQLLACINQKEDSLRIYRIREPKERFVKEYGNKRSIDFNEPLIF